MKGTIRSWNDSKGFGHITPEGGGEKVFFHFSTLVNSGERTILGEGVEVNYELDTPKPGQGPRAKSVKVLTPGAVPAPATATVPSSGLLLSWTIGEPTVGTDRITVPVWLDVSRSGKPAPGVEVTLKARDVVQGEGPVTTGPDGQAYFSVQLGSSVTACDLLATVEGKSFTRRWELPKKPQFKPTRLDIEDTKIEDGKYQLTFSVHDEAHNTGPAKIRLVFDQKVTLNGKTDFRHEFDIPDTGTVTIEVTFTAERVHYDAFELVAGIKEPNRTLIGPKPQRKSPKAGDGFTAFLTEGWE